jgi:hypothetical protein
VYIVIVAPKNTKKMVKITLYRPHKPLTDKDDQYFETQFSVPDKSFFAASVAAFKLFIIQ